jgi:hypothetical protein
MGHGIRLGPVQKDDATADEHRCMTVQRREHEAAESGYAAPGYHPGKRDCHA